MAEYSGSVTLISGIAPKNGGTFPLVNAPDILIDADTDKRLDEALEELQSSSLSMASDDDVSAMLDAVFGN